MTNFSQHNTSKDLHQRIKNLMLRKLLLKIREELVFIDKHQFAELIYADIVTLSEADSDIDKAMEIAQKKDPKYLRSPNSKRIELVEAAEEFEIEISAYSHYLENVDDEIDDEENYDDVLYILNNDDDLLHNKILQLISPKVEKFFQSGTNQFTHQQFELLVDNSLYYIKTIATNETVADAAEEIYSMNEEEFESRGLTLDSTIRILQDCLLKYQNEIKSYKLALNMHEQNAEIPLSIQLFKQTLGLPII